MLDDRTVIWNRLHYVNLCDNTEKRRNGDNLHDIIYTQNLYLRRANA